MTKYCYSFDQERYHGEFASREDAAAEAIDLRGEDATVYTAEMVEYHPDTDGAAEADRIIEVISDRANEEVGDVAEDWPDVTKEQLQELQSALDTVVAEWAAKHIGAATFFAVKDVVEHEVKANA